MRTAAFLFSLVTIAAAVPLGLWLQEHDVSSTCTFQFRMCPEEDAVCCILLLPPTEERIEAQTAVGLKEQIETTLDCNLGGTLMSEGYLGMLCDPSMAYDPMMQTVPTSVHPILIFSAEPARLRF